MPRAAKPTVLRALEGFAGHQPINEKEPTPKLVSADLKPPKYLPKKAVEKWNELFPMLRNCGILSIGDVELFARYCDLFAYLCAMRDDIKKNGYTIVSAQGTVLQNPSMSNYRAICEQMLKIEIQLGMTPASRTKIQAISVDYKIKDDFYD